MSSSRKRNPPSLTRNASLAERSLNKKISPLFRSPLRRISDPRFDRSQLYNSPGTSDNLQFISTFPRLIFSKGAKKLNGVVTLDTVCERKYRSWSDPTGEYTGDSDICSQSGTIYRDIDTIRAFLPKLEGEKSGRRDDLEERSFCDSVSSFPCSSISRSPVFSPVITDEREMCISKHKTVLNWIHNIGKTNGCVNK